LKIGKVDKITSNADKEYNNFQLWKEMIKTKRGNLPKYFRKS